MIRFVLFLAMFESNTIHSQVDSSKLDSLARRIASRHKLTDAYQDSFIKAQDSTYQVAVDRGRRDITSRDTSLLDEKKREEKRNESKIYVRLGFTVLLLVLLIIGLLRFRRKNKQR